MPFIYQADVLCDECGQCVIRELKLMGTVPADPDDESSYDSDDYPKRYDADAEQADSPQNCSTGECGGQYMRDGAFVYYGRFLENGLTEDGYKALQSMLNQHGATLPKFAQEWADFYQFTYFDNPYESAHDWLNQTISDHAAQIELQNTSSRHLGKLVSIALELASKLDSDQIQDSFQSEMDDDDYVKPTGWYSPEME